MAHLASARQCGHQDLRCDRADTMITKVGHYSIAVPVHRHSAGPVELRSVFSVLMATSPASSPQCRHYCADFAIAGEAMTGCPDGGTG
eukprot:8769520-Pyramimonas_sp.AAC.1